MFTYFIKRLASACFVIVLVLIFLALLVRLIPGDPITSMMGAYTDPQLAATLRSEMGVNQPLPDQVWHFGSRAVQGDLGTDIISQRSVRSEIEAAIPNTLTLIACSLGIALVVGSLLGIIAAANAGGVVDRTLGVVAVTSWTLPAYIGGLFLLLIFVVWLHVAPAFGAGSIGHPTSYASHLALPTLALALPWIGLVARLLRANLLEVINEPYLRTARAFGVSERKVLLKYALRNAMIPLIAFVALAAGNLLAGAVFVEQIFARPGLGSLLLNAVQTRNFPVVRGTAFVIAVFFVFINLTADVLYRVVDPRVMVERRG